MHNLREGIVIEDKTIHINCCNLFCLLIVLTKRQADTTPFFVYELTPVPTLLFKDDIRQCSVHCWPRTRPSL